MMRIVAQVLFGLALGLATLMLLLELGLLIKDSPDWHTAWVTFLVLGLTQAIAYYSFKRRLAAQITVGVLLFVAFVWWNLYSRHGFFWETTNLDESVSITWRTYIVMLVSVAAAQGLARLVFLWFATRRLTSLQR